MYELSDLNTLSPLFVVLFIHNHEAGKYRNVTLCTHILCSVNNNLSSVVPNTQAVTMVITIFRRDDLRSHASFARGCCTECTPLTSIVTKATWSFTFLISSLSRSRFNKNIYYQPSFVDIPLISPGFYCNT